jgi:hypothetical protein
VDQPSCEINVGEPIKQSCRQFDELEGNECHAIQYVDAKVIAMQVADVAIGNVASFLSWHLTFYQFLGIV